MGAQSACQQTFIALGQAKVSLFLALLRKIVLLIPLIYLIPMFFTGNEAKLFGVFLAEPVSTRSPSRQRSLCLQYSSVKLCAAARQS